MRRIVLAAMMSLSLAQGASAQTKVTVHELTDAFAASALLCMTALERGVKLTDLPEWRKDNWMRPASAEQRRSDPRIRDDATPMWAPAAGPLIVSEPPGRCEIIANQLPVDVAFNLTIGIVRTKWPDFTETPVKVEAMPVARQIVREANGARYILNLQGAEPNAPILRNKVSVLRASVVKDNVATGAAAKGARRQAVLDVLNKNPSRFLRVWPNIPADDLQNVLKKSAGSTADRDVLGVIDTSVSREGGVGLYFFADGMVSVKPVTGSTYIAYDAIRGIKADKGVFVVKYGAAELQAGVNKDEIVVLVDAILATTQPK